MKVISTHALYDASSGEYLDVEYNGVDEICELFRRRDFFYDKIYDYFRVNKFNSPEEISEKLCSVFRLTVDPEDVYEFLDLPFEKIYHCPECGYHEDKNVGVLVMIPERKIMGCNTCGATFSLVDNYICPICRFELKFGIKSQKFECASCGNSISPHRFAKPKDNWISNEFGKGWEKVTPDGQHRNAPPMSDVGIYPNPYR